MTHPIDEIRAALIALEPPHTDTRTEWMAPWNTLSAAIDELEELRRRTINTGEGEFVQNAIKEEREACAAIAERGSIENGGISDWGVAGNGIAAAIRARGTTRTHVAEGGFDPPVLEK